MKKNEDRIAILTISAINYQAMAKILLDSCTENSVQADLYYFILDGNKNDLLKLKSKNIHFILPDDLFEAGIIEKGYFYSMMLYYNIMEAATAVKPMVLLYLLRDKKYRKALYLDPDMMVFDNLASVFSEFDQHDVLLTPHLLKFNFFPVSIKDELGVLKSGGFNLGFLGLKKSNETIKFLIWWAQRLYKFSTIDVCSGLFTDQKWIDIAATIFQSKKILRDFGLNVAHWNLCERKLTLKKGKVFVNEESLKIFHFSGYDYFNPKKLSKYSDSILVAKNPALKKLAGMYTKKLNDRRHGKLRKIPYRYYYFSNGIEIPAFIRLWAKHNNQLPKYRNLFDARSEKSFFNVLLKSDQKSPCMLIEIVWSIRKDLQNAFPLESYGRNRDLLNWFMNQGLKDYPLDPKLLNMLSFKYKTFIDRG